eukprot:scaffold19567_cov47-Phaeocystis_antarctica.AAC.1
MAACSRSLCERACGTWFTCRGGQAWCGKAVDEGLAAREAARDCARRLLPIASAPGARWAGSGLPLPFGAETPLPLPLAQQPALGAGGWCGRGEPWVWMLAQQPALGAGGWCGRGEPWVWMAG